MKKMYRLFLVLLIACVSMPALADPSILKAEAKSEGVSAVQYELSLSVKAVKSPKDIVAKIEASEAFKNAECAPAKAKGKGVWVFQCQKPDAQTDALFRSQLKPGVTVTLSPYKAPTVKALAATCPFGCRWATACNPLGACCRIAVPNQLCPTQ